MKRVNRRQKAQDFINKHSRVFKEGGEITERELCSHFGIRKPQMKPAKSFKDAAKRVRKYDFAKLAAYTAVNKLARPAGAVVSQKGDTYKVMVNPHTTPVTNYYKNRIVTLSKQLSELE